MQEFDGTNRQEQYREEDGRDLAAVVEADRRGQIAWINYPAETRGELVTGLNTALGIQE